MAPDDRLISLANLLGVDVREVRQAVSRARRHYPNETDDELFAIAADTLRRTVQQRALDAARKSIGR